MPKRFLTYFFFTLCLFSCLNKIDSNDFWIHDYNLNHIVKVPNNDVVHIKNNIYKHKDKLYLTIAHFVTKSNYQNQIFKVNAGKFLLDSIDDKAISNLIDLDSYKELKKEGSIHIDKNSLYISQLENGCHHCIKVLNVNVSQFKVLDDSSSYGFDGDKIYCLRYGKEIKTKYPKTFQVIEINNSKFGIDSTSIYSMCDPMSPSDFMKYYDHIEYKVRDSIVKRYFQ